jgi:hypothetical protein
MTVVTNPGRIPDDKEWDMLSDSNNHSECDSEKHISEEEYKIR